MSEEAILVHGWDPNYYNSQIEDEKDESLAWSHRSEFIEQLKSHFNLKYYNLPGFCQVHEPKAEKFDVEDFVEDFTRWKNSLQEIPRLMIGYSFGGAILLAYKAKSQDTTPVILISPAIFRRETARSVAARNFKQLIPYPLPKYFKHLYQLATSEYYRRGTPFLRKTYDIIVRRDLRPFLDSVDTDSLLLIYGTNDDVTPWSLVEQSVKKSGIDYHLISNSGHGVVRTHSNEIIKVINNFLQS